MGFSSTHYLPKNFKVHLNGDQSYVFFYQTQKRKSNFKRKTKCLRVGEAMCNKPCKPFVAHLNTCGVAYKRKGFFIAPFPPVSALKLLFPFLRSTNALLYTQTVLLLCSNSTRVRSECTFRDSCGKRYTEVRCPENRKI